MPSPTKLLFYPVPPRAKWFQEARFGVSYHWGLYSIPGRGEWVRSAEQMPVETYQQYFNEFTAKYYSPHEWAEYAVKAGAKYGILTTKHHDGFCLFDSQLTDYKSTNTPAKRDLVSEFVEAFRSAGLRVGLYYSLVDWYHPDYPAYQDRQHPMRHNLKFQQKKHCWENYVQYFHGQVRELLTNYGRIDLLIFDFSYWDFVGEKWHARELIKMIRELQPDIVINDRLGNAESGSIKDVPPPPWVGDFDTCEMNVPHSPPTDSKGRILLWDLWIPHNNSWSFRLHDYAYKSPEILIRTLVNCVSKNGNLTLNFSPDGYGKLPEPSIKVQEEIGKWLEKNGDSIYGCTMAPLERPDWGRWTTKGEKLFAHITEQPIGHLTLPGLRGKVRNPRLLAYGTEVFLSDFWNKPVQSFGKQEDIFLNFGRPIHETFILPDPIDTVVVLDWVPEEEQAEEVRKQTIIPNRQPF